jgi:hypothetical protein
MNIPDNPISKSMLLRPDEILLDFVPSSGRFDGRFFRSYWVSLRNSGAVGASRRPFVMPPNAFARNIAAFSPY